MMKSFLFILLLVLGSTARSNAQEETNKPLIAFDAIVKIMKENYFDQNYHGLDWAKLTSEARNKILAEKDSAIAYEEIKTLLKKLGHSHLEFHPSYAKKNQAEFVNFAPTGSQKEIPFSFEILDEQIVITKIDDKSDAYKVGLRSGLLVQEINEYKVKDLLAKFKVHAQMYFPLFMNPNNIFHFKGVDYQNKSFDIKFNVEPYKGQLISFGNIQGYPCDFESAILKENIGFVRFNIFLFEPVKKAVEAIKTMKDCKGIIIDLRNNPGGIGNLSCAIAKEFCNINYLLGTQRTTANNGVSELRFSVQAQKSPYLGKVIILINESSASTAEVLAIGMQENKSAIVIGTKSPGLALPSLIITLEDGSIFQYPIADFKTPLGKSLESIGVKPDYEIKQSPEKLAAGEDLLISKAIELILKN
jgi:carboxyl-terminal processing protease